MRSGSITDVQQPGDGEAEQDEDAAVVEHRERLQQDRGEEFEQEHGRPGPRGLQDAARRAVHHTRSGQSST